MGIFTNLGIIFPHFGKMDLGGVENYFCAPKFYTVIFHRTGNGKITGHHNIFKKMIFWDTLMVIPCPGIEYTSPC